MATLRVFPDSESMAEEIASIWRDQIQQAEKTDDVFSVVLSGGATASLVYRNLANLNSHLNPYIGSGSIFSGPMSAACLPSMRKATISISSAPF